MRLVKLEDMGKVFGWHGASAYFNAKQYGFPEPAFLSEKGEIYYSVEEIIKWDKERPLQPSEEN